MIYTVTLNPTLDITYVLENISFGEPVTAVEVHKNPGGKGINVSRALRAMGTDTVTMSMVGGHVGDEVLDLLQSEGLILQIVRIKNETRTNVIVLGQRDGRELIIRAAGPPVEKTDTEKVTNLVFQIAQTPEVLVLSGSLPPGTQDDIYYHITTEGKERGSKVVVDCEGGPLVAAIEAGPYLIKPNIIEFSELAGVEFKSDGEIIKFARTLNEKGVEIVVVSLGKKGAILVTREEALRGVVPVVSDDTVGAGDSMVAGLVMGVVQALPLERAFHIGLAASVSAVMNKGPGLAEPDTFARAFPMIAVERV
ncbi:MAG: 1-phosphofructokinase family hexose kinase [Candidatus Geothermincolia bacterium]